MEKRQLDSYIADKVSTLLLEAGYVDIKDVNYDVPLGKFDGCVLSLSSQADSGTHFCRSVGQSTRRNVPGYPSIGFASSQGDGYPAHICC